MSECTSARQWVKKDLPSVFASEFSMLALLLAVCTALNRKDVCPTFASSSEELEESWLWREARKFDPYLTVIDAVIAILVLDQENLAGMAAGESTYVLTSSCDPVVTHEDKETDGYQVDMHSLNFATASDLKDGGSVPELGYCTAMPDGINYWAVIKTTGDRWHIFNSEEWVFNILPACSSFTVHPQISIIVRPRNNCFRVSKRLSKSGKQVRPGQDVFPVF